MIGLGNPGSRFSETRHNVGRWFVESLARSHRLKFSKKKSLEASLVSFQWEGTELVLATPETFMNLSGEAVRRLVDHLEIDFQKELLIAVDDIALPLGRLRLRARGSDGGHQGLRSIHQSLASANYARLRFGIAPAEGEAPLENIEDYVLSSFSGSEKKNLPDLFKKGEQTCRLWLSQSIEAAMNFINPRKNKT